MSLPGAALGVVEGCAATVEREDAEFAILRVVSETSVSSKKPPPAYIRVRRREAFVCAVITALATATPVKPEIDTAPTATS